MNYNLNYNPKPKIKYLLVFIIAIIFVFVGLIFASTYSMSLGDVSLEVSQSNFESFYQTIKPGTFKNSYTHFDGTETVIFNVTKGNKIKINYTSTINDGVLIITINDSNANILNTLPVSKKGTLTIVATGTGKIRITVVGKNTSGSFEILWKKLLF